VESSLSYSNASTGPRINKTGQGVFEGIVTQRRIRKIEN